MYRIYLLSVLLLGAGPVVPNQIILDGDNAAGGGGLSIGLVDCAQSGAQTGALTSASMNITGGSAVVIGVMYDGGFQDVTGSVNTGYTQIGTTQTGLWTSRLYYKQNLTGGAQTFTLDLSFNYGTMCVVEILGASTTAALDTGSSTFDSAEAYTGSALTTTAADTVLVAWFARDYTGADCNASESTFTLQGEEANGSVLCGDIWTKIVSSTGTYNVSSNDDGTDSGAGVHLAAIK